MSGAAARRPRLDAASAAIRTALRGQVEGLALGGEARGDGRPLLLAVSGGGDSLALASAAAFLHRRGEATFLACTVDHGLQEDSAEVAASTLAALRELGLPAVSVRLGQAAGTVEAPIRPGGLEARARSGRYAALARVARDHGCAGLADIGRADTGRAEAGLADAAGCRVPYVLTAHTQDDQAESVLLGLMRGSGARSLAGMAPESLLQTDSGDVRVLRPLLGVAREQTQASCAAQGLSAWQDPMNEAREFARVRARQLLERFEEELGQGLRSNLARTADLLRDDADLLDAQAERALRELTGPSGRDAAGDAEREGLSLAALVRLPAAVRTRVLRLWLLEVGVSAQELTAGHVRRAGELVRSGGPGRRRISVPGGLAVLVRAGELVVESA